MSGTLNKVMLIGHLGDDVKIKHFDNGGCLARFPLATNESYTNKTTCLLYTSPSPRDLSTSRMPSSA